MQVIDPVPHPATPIMPILRAKLTPAQRREGQVVRSRLIEQLKAGQTKPLTIVSAPGGYGKTTAVAQWLDSLDQPTSWLTLDLLDNNLETFVTYLLASVQIAFPEAGYQTSALLQSPQAVPATILADALIEDLADLPDSLILALDEYQLIADSEVEAFMERLVQFLPTNSHLVLIGRTDPALPLSRLRARGEVAEVHASDLQFSADEAQRLLANLVSEPVDTQSASLLQAQTEGWALGLQFAALARHRGETIASLVRRFEQEGHHLAADYLVDEVLARQPHKVQDFLLRTSILEQICAPLSETVLGSSGQTIALDKLSRSNVLITPLDDRRYWFRYHPLFRETLRRELSKVAPIEEIQALNRRAAEWFAREGLIGEAIKHALAAGDQDMAVRLVGENMHPILKREEWWRIARWLDQLPETAQHHPIVLIARGWLGIASYRLAGVAQMANEAETEMANFELSSAERISLQAQIDIQKALLAYWRGDSETSLALAKRALTSLPPALTYAFGVAQLYHGLAQYAVGRPAEALAYLQAAMAAQTNEEDVLLARLVLGLCSMNLELGDLPALKRSGNLMGKLASRSKLQNSLGWAKYADGLIAYEWNDLSKAEVSLRHVANSPHRYSSLTAYESYLLLILTLQAQGRPNAADDILHLLQEFLLETNNLPAMPLVQALERELALMRGMPVVLLTAAPPGVSEAVADLRLSFTISPHLTQARCLIEAGTPECLQAASSYLAVMRQTAESLYLRRRLVKILALEALVAAGLGDEARATDLLRQSLELAKAGNLIRTFVDCGPELIPLLEKLSTSGTAKKYVERILGAFVGEVAQESKLDLTSHNDDTLLQLRASLTNREQEVLLLLANRMSNKEIAARLFLAPETVKKYTARIYQKLGVNNRRAAVSLAERIGLLSVL